MPNRQRNISPTMYENEHYMLLSPAAKVIWPGLWTCSDRNGVFEWRPLKWFLRFAYGAQGDANAIFQELLDAGFVIKFEKDDKSYGFCPTWTKWQAPHPDEAPAYPMPTGHPQFTPCVPRKWSKLNAKWLVEVYGLEPQLHGAEVKLPKSNGFAVATVAPVGHDSGSTVVATPRPSCPSGPSCPSCPSDGLANGQGQSDPSGSEQGTGLDLDMANQGLPPKNEQILANSTLILDDLLDITPLEQAELPDEADEPPPTSSEVPSDHSGDEGFDLDENNDIPEDVAAVMDFWNDCAEVVNTNTSDEAHHWKQVPTGEYDTLVPMTQACLKDPAWFPALEAYLPIIAKHPEAFPLYHGLKAPKDPEKAPFIMFFRYLLMDDRKSGINRVVGELARSVDQPLTQKMIKASNSRGSWTDHGKQGDPRGPKHIEGKPVQNPPPPQEEEATAGFEEDQPTPPRRPVAVPTPRPRTANEIRSDLGHSWCRALDAILDAAPQIPWQDVKETRLGLALDKVRQTFKYRQPVVMKAFDLFLTTAEPTSHDDFQEKVLVWLAAENFDVPEPQQALDPPECLPPLIQPESVLEESAIAKVDWNV